MYHVAIVFEPHLIYKSRRYAKGCWFNKLFAPLLEDILTLKLINGYHITYNTIVIMQLRDIWGRDKPPLLKVIEHDHIHDDTHSKCGDVYMAEEL